MCQEYEGYVLIQGEGGVQRVIQFQLTNLLRWTSERGTRKNVKYADNRAITKQIVPTYLYLGQILLLFMYFIYDVMYSSINKLLNKKYYHFLKNNQ